MSLYNPISFFFALVICALVAGELGSLLAGSQVVWLIMVAELAAFYWLYRTFKARSAEKRSWYSVIFVAFAFLTLASVFFIGMISPIGGITALISLLTT